MEVEPRHTPPPVTAKPAKSILKSPRARPEEGPRPGLVWNETNLEETSRERGTRRKIEEVETPYAWPGDYSIGPLPPPPLALALALLERSCSPPGSGFDEICLQRSRGVNSTIGVLTRQIRATTRARACCAVWPTRRRRVRPPPPSTSPRSAPASTKSRRKVSSAPLLRPRSASRRQAADVQAQAQDALQRGPGVEVSAARPRPAAAADAAQRAAVTPSAAPRAAVTLIHGSCQGEPTRSCISLILDKPRRFLDSGTPRDS